jgi:predicted signal transduction protein with EAL and GGDEF domain
MVPPPLDILNRRGFERELKRSLAYLQRYKGEAALLCIDLDGFKDDRCARQGHVCAEEGDAGVNCSGIRQKRKNNAFDLSRICRLVPIWMRDGCCYVSTCCTEYN